MDRWMGQQKEMLQLKELSRDTRYFSKFYRELNWQVHSPSRMGDIRNTAEASEKDHQIVSALIVKKLWLLMY